MSEPPTAEQWESARRLLGEVVSWHADKDGPDYNDCDEIPCAWCEQAKALTDPPK